MDFILWFKCNQNRDDVLDSSIQSTKLSVQPQAAWFEHFLTPAAIHAGVLRKAH